MDSSILRVLGGSTPSKPLDLVGLIHGIDWLNKTVLHVNEFNAVLGPLVEAGQAVQSANGYWLSSKPRPAKFVPISPSAYTEAVTRYRSEFEEAYRALRAKDDHSIMVEAQAWCQPRFRMDEVQFSLRSPELQPSIIRHVDAQGIVTADSRKWAATVHDLVIKRRALLQGKALGSPRGRLLAYRPQDNLFDGAAQVASSKFFDVNNVPPWDTWIKFVDGVLFAWIPAEAEALVQSGIDANPEVCIWWADYDGECPIEP